MSFLLGYIYRFVTKYGASTTFFKAALLKRPSRMVAGQ